jgi:hypothetical protein
MVRDGMAYICASDVCQSFPSADALAPPVPFFGLFQDPNAFESTFASSIAGVNLETRDETIAGQSARCFSASGSAGADFGEGEWCWSTEGGLMLRVRATSAGSTYEIEATGVEDVSEGDLDPPYPTQEIPGLDDIPQP